VGDRVSEVSELISIVTNIIKRASIFNVLLLVGVSVFLVAYFDTSSLHTALGASVLTVSLVYIIGKGVVEPLVRIGLGIAPRRGEFVRYVAALLQAFILGILGRYLMVTSPHGLSHSAYWVIALIIIIGLVAYLLLYLDYVERVVSRLTSRRYVVIE